MIDNKPHKGIWGIGHIKQAADVILNTRDFCGDEKNAFIDFCDDNDLPRLQTKHMAVIELADKIWENSRRGNV